MAGNGRYSDISNFNTRPLKESYKYLDQSDIDYLEKNYSEYKSLIKLRYLIKKGDYDLAHLNDEINDKGIFYRDQDENNSDIDIQSGNIHPSKSRIDEEKNSNTSNTIKQIILATKNNPAKYCGPYNGKIDISNKEEVLKYSSLFYPMFITSDNVDVRLQEILKKIFEEISK